MSFPIYADLLTHCEPVRMRPPWGRFAKPADLWRPSADPRAIFTALRRQHADQDLIGCGVAVRNDDGTIEAGDILGEPPVCILPLRAAAQRSPFDLLIAEGAVSGQLPFYAAVHDHVVAAAVRKWGVLCLAFSFRDLLSLRALRIPVTPASGLEHITRQSLAQFRDAMRFPGPNHPPKTEHAPSASTSASCPPGAQQAPAGIVPPRLVLVGWCPSRLSPQRPQNVDPFVRSLQAMGGFCDVALEETLLWRPTPLEIRRIALCLTSGARRDVLEAICESIDSSGKPLAPPPSDKDSSGSLLESRTRFRAALLQPDGNPEQRRRRLRDYQAAVENTFVRPMLERAASESDADERSRLGGLAAANRLLHVNVELYWAKFEREIARKGVRGVGEMPETRELMKMFDIVYKFSQGKK